MSEEQQMTDVEVRLRHHLTFGLFGWSYEDCEEHWEDLTHEMRKVWNAGRDFEYWRGTSERKPDFDAWMEKYKAERQVRSLIVGRQGESR
jgi:hypothetical protein